MASKSGTTKSIVSTAEAAPPMYIFSQPVIPQRYVYVSGNFGCRKDFTLVEGRVQAQTRDALENLSVVLKAASSCPEHIVKANVDNLTSMPRDFQPMNEVYAEFFDKTICLLGLA